MTAISGLGLARLAGCLFGVLLAAAVMLASQPAGGSAVGADVSAYSNQTGELAIEPAGPADFLHSSNLLPGDSSSGSFRVTNQTGAREALRATAVPSSHALDRSLSVEISSGDSGLASGLLGSPEAGDPLVLGPGQTATVSVRVSLAPDIGEKAAAALVEIAIVFQPEAGAP